MLSYEQYRRHCYHEHMNSLTSSHNVSKCKTFILLTKWLFEWFWNVVKILKSSHFSWNSFDIRFVRNCGFWCQTHFKLKKKYPQTIVWNRETKWNAQKYSWFAWWIFLQKSPWQHGFESDVRLAAFAAALPIFQLKSQKHTKIPIKKYQWFLWNFYNWHHGFTAWVEDLFDTSVLFKAVTILNVKIISWQQYHAMQCHPVVEDGMNVSRIIKQIYITMTAQLGLLHMCRDQIYSCYKHGSIIYL